MFPLCYHFGLPGPPPDAAPSPESAEYAGSLGEADARTRTGDPFITSEVLYQLSYVGAAGPV
jgi:hypothetical protein